MKRNIIIERYTPIDPFYSWKGTWLKFIDPVTKRSFVKDCTGMSHDEIEQIRTNFDWYCSEAELQPY